MFKYILSSIKFEAYRAWGLAERTKTQETSNGSSSTITCGMQSLPVEVKLQILAELPVKEIMQIRRVSRDFKEVIDEPTNQKTLLRPAQSRAIARLQRSVDELLDYDPTEGFWTNFSNFVAHRGIPWHHEVRKFEVRYESPV